MISNSRVSIVAALALSLAVIATCAHSQTPTDSTQSATDVAPATSPGNLLHGGPMGELLAISVPRQESELQRLIQEARGLGDLAESEIQSSKSIATEAEGRAKIMKEELEVTKARRDAAKKSKDKVAVAELDVKFKQQDREYKYLTKLVDASRADADRLQSANAAADATVRSLELELQLAQKQAQMSDNPPPQAVNEYRTVLRNMLEAQSNAADQARDAATKRKKLVSERIKQLDALAKLGQ